MKIQQQKYEKFSDEELHDYKSDITPNTAFETQSWITRMDCRKMVSQPTEGGLKSNPRKEETQVAEPLESAWEMF